ncbi:MULTISPECIES: hypothetical protein [Microbacterium]|uniref:Uncharacterized protein n=1 Tax=Microbacterium aquilitoris TaxID=3067307 RepID=A0ABU3GH58_9MICO|nr:MULTISPECIES: hypothetical protein [unclassified Microbacterium]MDT3330036.1 hypothetical protein [Microbacterium sp. KSW-18]MDT3345868.1 hypothetical protein [Microbacterium sp. KSW2-22]
MSEHHPSPGTVWARVEDGFHVGSRDGNFLGYIERRRDGRYDAFDMRSAVIGTFADLVSAMRTLSSVPTPAPGTNGILTIRENR